MTPSSLSVPPLCPPGLPEVGRALPPAQGTEGVASSPPSPSHSEEGQEGTPAGGTLRARVWWELGLGRMQHAGGLSPGEPGGLLARGSAVRAGLGQWSVV